MNPEKHEQLKSQLSAYLDGELTGTERREAQAFLAEDEEARALLQDLRETVSALKALPRTHASDELLEGLRARKERRELLGEVPTTESIPNDSTMLGGQWMAAAAVIALTFLAGYFMWPFTNSKPLAEAPSKQYAFKPEQKQSVAGRDSERAQRMPIATNAEQDIGRVKNEPLSLFDPTDSEESGAAPRPAKEVFNLDKSAPEVLIADTNEVKTPSFDNGRQEEKADPDLLLRLKAETSPDADSASQITDLKASAGMEAPESGHRGDGDEGGVTVIEMAYVDEASRGEEIEFLRSRFVSLKVGIRSLDKKLGAPAERTAMGLKRDQADRIPRLRPPPPSARLTFQMRQTAEATILTFDVPDSSTLADIVTQLQKRREKRTDMRVLTNTTGMAFDVPDEPGVSTRPEAGEGPLGNVVANGANAPMAQKARSSGARANQPASVLPSASQPVSQPETSILRLHLRVRPPAPLTPTATRPARPELTEP